MEKAEQALLRSAIASVTFGGLIVPWPGRSPTGESYIEHVRRS